MTDRSNVATEPKGADLQVPVNKRAAAAERAHRFALHEAEQSKARSGGILLTIYALMVSSWMFDFRTEVGSSTPVLGLFLGSYFFFSLMFFALDDQERYNAPGLQVFMVAAMLFLVVGVGRGVSNHQDIGEILRLSLPTATYIITAYATTRAAMVVNIRKLRLTLAWLCLGYVVFAVVVQRLVGGAINLEEVRFQIIGGATLPALGYLACMVLYGLGVVEMAALTSVLIVVFLSVTRTFIVSSIVQMAGVIPAMRIRFSPRFFLLTILGVLLLGGAFVSGRFGIDRWSERIFGGKDAAGTDFSYYTRESEWAYMESAITSTTTNLAFGNGIAAKTIWYNAKEAGGRAQNSTGFGHNQHLSLLFISGLAGGLFLLAIQFYQGLQSFTLLFRLSRMRRVPSDTLFLAAWGATIILGVVATNFFAALLGARGQSLWYGVGTGLFIGARARFLRDRAAAILPATRAQPAKHEAPTKQEPWLPPAVRRRRLVLQEAAAGNHG